MNAIPRSGGNTSSGSVLVNGSAPSLQCSNVTERLMAAAWPGVDDAEEALRPQRRARRTDQAGQAVVLRDVALLHQRVLPGGRFYPRIPRPCGAPNDTASQAFGGTYTYDNNGRVTWAINDKQKLSGWYAFQYKVDPYWTDRRCNHSPEAVRITTWHTQLSTTKWTYTATNRLLFEAGVTAGASPDTIMPSPIASAVSPSGAGQAPRAIRSPSAAHLSCADRASTSTIGCRPRASTASTSYVTGSHSAKFGMDMQRGHFWRGDNNDSTGGIWYTTREYVPNLVTIQAPTPAGRTTSTTTSASSRRTAGRSIA